MKITRNILHRRRKKYEFFAQRLFIIKIKIFYAFIIVLAVGSLYLNYLTIKRTFQFLYEELGQAARSD